MVLILAATGPAVFGAAVTARQSPSPSHTGPVRGSGATATGLPAVGAARAAVPRPAPGMVGPGGARIGASERNASPWNASGWYDVGGSSDSSPTSTVLTTFAYDPTLGGDLYFGGESSASALLNETWLFGASGWHELSPARSPPALEYAAMAWDSADSEMVLFGGTTGSYLALNATWTYANGTWTNVSQSVAPPPLWSGAMFSDADDGSVILFGGYAIPTSGPAYYSNATWQFTGGQWRHLNETHAPSPRDEASVTWDSTIDEGILFGGFVQGGEAGSGFYSDTWAFTHGAWTELSPTATPGARQAAVMGNDPALDGVVLFGGELATPIEGNDTWVFAADNWTRFASGPAPPLRTTDPVGLATAPDARSLILFAPANPYPDGEPSTRDTWEFSTLQPTILPTPSVEEGNAPVAFVASVTGVTVADNLTWTFGDGSMDTGPAVAHVFASPGPYTVTVTVTDLAGRVANASRTLRVYPPLAFEATVAPPVGQTPLTVRFAGSLSGGDPPYAIHWSSATLPNLTGTNGSFAIERPGTYWLVFAGTDAGNYSVGRAFLVTALAPQAPTALSATIVTNVSAGAAPLPVTFVGVASGGTPPYTFAWRFADGTLQSGETVTRTFGAPGPYATELTVTDGGGDQANAVASVNVTGGFYVTVQGADTIASSTVVLNASGFDGASPYSFYWEWGDGSASDGAEVQHTFARSGTYPVELTGIDATGHRATARTNVSVTVPVANPIPPPSGSAISGTLVTIGVTAAAIGALLGGGIVLARYGGATPRRAAPRRFRPVPPTTVLRPPPKG